MTERSKINSLCAAFVLSLVLAGACTDNEPSRTLDQDFSASSGNANGGSGNRPSGGTSGRGGSAGSSSGGTDGGPGPDTCLEQCADQAACTPEEQLLVDFCRMYAKRCPDQPADVLMERQPGEEIPAGPEVPSTATRPQLSEAEAELYTLETALRAGGVYTVSYTGSGDTGEGGAGGAGGASGGEPLGERTVTYEAEDDWDPTGPIEDVNKIVPGLLVDPETGGDDPMDEIYPTIQAAISAAVVVAGCPRVFIKVMPGRYPEKITVPAKTSTPPVTLYGVDRDPGRIVIVKGHSAAGEELADGGCGDILSVHASATFTNSLPQPFQARNLTIQNNYVGDHCPGGDQTAVALLSQADKALFDNVRILGHRNALYVKSTGTNEVSRVYFKNSYIEGDEDMILGRGAAVIDQSRIHSLGDRVSGGAITAPSTRVDNPHGILIINSELTADANVSNVYLGNTWYEGDMQESVGKTIVRNSILGAHIRADDVWAPTTRATPKNPTPSSVVLYTSDDYYVPGAGLIPPEIYLAEFGNSGPGAAAAP